MNLLDGYVVQILSEPYFEYDRWWVIVRYDCYGSISQSTLMFNTKEEADGVFIGYKFVS